MAIISSLYTGVSGLTANGTAMSIIGDNIANANTVGFKSSRASFGDVLSQNLIGSSGNYQIGRGTMLTGVSPTFSQGSFQSTESGLDMGIDGDGFFMVKDPNNTTFYTRAGQFSIDDGGFLVNPEGYKVQGYLASATGAITSSVGDMSLSSSLIAPSASTNVTIGANLNAGAAIIPVLTLFDPANPASYDYSTGITVYDALGNGTIESVYFRKTADIVGPPPSSTWDVYAPGSASGNTPIGALTFDGTGNQLVPATLSSTFASIGGGLLSLNLGSTTQYAVPSTVLSQSQDGYPSGSLRSVSVGQDGILTALFSNGMTRGIGEVALGKFQNPNGLTKFGRNLYAENMDSGQVTVGAPGTGGYGTTLSNSLELSNVDIAREFVNMITAQRGFQANSKIITTSDEMLADIINLKR